MSKRKNESPLYACFEIDKQDNRKMKCIIGECNKSVSKEYSSLTFHLKKHHVDEWQKCQEKRELKHQNIDKNQKSIKDCVPSKSAVKALGLDLSANDSIPFSVFDTPGLKNLFQAAAAQHNEKISANSSNMKTMPQNCFTCNSELGSCRIPLSCKTETTQTPLKELLESIGDISLSRKNKSEGVLCNQCYTVVERFDYLQDQSRKVQVRLAGMLKRAQPEEIYIKEEPDESIDDESELSNADESDDDDDWSEMHQSKRLRTSAKEIPNDKMEDETKDEIDFNCKECSEKFKTDLCLQMHLATDHDRNEGEVDCPICFKTCEDRSSLKQHYTKHTLPRSLLCGQCGATFAYRTSFDMHMLMHEDKKEFVCSIAGCSMKFISNGKLLRHLRVHSGEKTLKHSRLKHQQGLNMLNKNLDKNKDANSEVCKICGVRIPSKAKMKQHLTKIHDVILDG